MKPILYAFLIIFITISIFAADYDKKVKQILGPIVKLDFDNSSGTATVIYSKKVKDEVKTFALTNYHVIKESIKANFKTQVVLIKTIIFTRNNNGNSLNKFETSSIVVAYDQDKDLAIIEILDPTIIVSTAKLLPKETQLSLFQEVYTVGCGYGNDPYFNNGEINELHSKHGMTNSSITFGYSGGGVFAKYKENYYLSGIVRSIYRDRGGNFIFWMVRFIRLKEIRNFLKDKNFEFIENEKDPPKINYYPIYNPDPILDVFRFDIIIGN
ncbi:MAG: S1 family peptidase [Candidatus Hodarchaeales archaeon]|jgi:hypothetical protein